MSTDLMTLKEIAERLRLSERTVSRLAHKGEIPALKVAHQWRFDRAAIDDWMTKRGSVPVTEQRLPATATGVLEPLTVADAINPTRIKLDLLATERDSVLMELVALVIDNPVGRLPEMLFAALKAREDLCPTCIREGVAVPHARNALVGVVDKPVLAYGRHRTGVNFGALDGKPVRHFFLLCAPNVRDHLHLLAQLARLINRPEFIANLDAAEQPEDITGLIRVTEQSLG